MLCLTALLIATCAFVSANNGPFGPLGQAQSYGQAAPTISSILPISPITPISPLSPATYSEISLQIPPVPPGLCIPDVIRIPLVPCPIWPPNDLAIQQKPPIVIPYSPQNHMAVSPFPNGLYPSPDDQNCDLRNPGFVKEYTKALQLIQEAISEIKSHTVIHEGKCHDATRQYLAILELWMRIQLLDNQQGSGIRLEDYIRVAEESVSAALYNPVQVAEQVNWWVAMNLQATANIRTVIESSLRQNRLDLAEFNIASVVRHNPALQAEANLLLQIGEAASAYLTMATTFEKISLTGCVVPYLVKSKYDMLQLVERSKPALRSLNNADLPFGPRVPLSL